MKKKKQIFILILAVVFVLSVVLSLQGYSIGLINYGDMHSYYSDMDSATIKNSTWIYPVVDGHYRAVCIFPFFGFHSEGPPYKAGITIVDYNNKNNSIKAELTELTVVLGEKEMRLVDKNTSSIISEFKPYIDRVAHVKAECIVETGNWLGRDNKMPLLIRARYKIHDKNGIHEDELAATVKPHHNVGFYSFLEAFNE